LARAERFIALETVGLAIEKIGTEHFAPLRGPRSCTRGRAASFVGGPHRLRAPGRTRAHHDRPVLARDALRGFSAREENE
jgi:hypothetical protein